MPTPTLLTRPNGIARGSSRGGSYPRSAHSKDFDKLAGRIMQRSPRMTTAQAQFVAKAWATAGDDGLQLRADPAHKLPNAVLYRRAEAEACWRNATAPVLLVAGAESNILDLLGDASGGNDQAMPFPDCKSLVIENAGHMVHFEAPQVLASAIEAFFQPTL